MRDAKEGFTSPPRPIVPPRKRRPPPGVFREGAKSPGDDLLSPSTDYHRPRVLNGRVRDGNGCAHTGVVAGMPTLYQPAAVGVTQGLAARGPGVGTNAAKRSAVSTGQLSTLPCLHTRPIDPVVFRGPSPKRKETCPRGGLRA
jgi:hypothetical protein